MASKHTVAEFPDGMLVRRLRDVYWIGYSDRDDIDDGDEWIPGARLNLAASDGYWSPEALLAALCDVLRKRLPEDDASPEADRLARLCGVLDEMRGEGSNGNEVDS